MTTIVYGVNHETLTNQETIISAASCTTHCLALMASTLNQLTPIIKGSMITIQAYTGDQMTLDGRIVGMILEEQELWQLILYRLLQVQLKPLV